MATCESGHAAIDEGELLAVAVEAADAAGAELLARFGHRASGVRTKSSATDPVSDADLAAEAAIRHVLASRRPHDRVLGEEGGEQPGAEGQQQGAEGHQPVRWVVDPLDGTVNFLFGIPLFAVSVACEDRWGTIAGVVLDPVRGERFAATRSGPATLDGTTIHGSEQSELAQALIATGFSYDARVRAGQADVLARVLPAARDIRRGGSAALDLAWCACGRFDAYFERAVKEWDVAAGQLIAARAGLQARRLAALPGEPEGIAVAPAPLIGPLLELLGAH
jgi:myo-inositol-1(or 4)-monophosphatase